MFTKEYDPPKYDGSGNIRDGLREALKLLKEAGWSFKNEKLVNDKTGQPFEFEILLSDPQMERDRAALCKNLERMGITARVRTVDNAQYEKRMETFDYDMAVVVFGQSLSPGNEQRELLGLGSGRRAGQPQPARHQEPGRRRTDRGADHSRPTAPASSPTRMRSTGSCSTAIT